MGMAGMPAQYPAVPARSSNKGMYWALGGIIGLAVLIIAGIAGSRLSSKNQFQAGGRPVSGWRNYVSPLGKYSVDFPGNPKIEKQMQPTAVGMIDIHAAAVEPRPNNALMVMYNDYPSSPLFDTSAALNGAGQGWQTQGTVLSQSDIRLDGHRGIEIRFKANSPSAFRMVRLYMVGNRMYQLIYAGDSIPEADVQRFMDSFRVR